LPLGLGELWRVRQLPGALPGRAADGHALGRGFRSAVLLKALPRCAGGATQCPRGNGRSQ
jgi:hypothetical protein